MHEAQLNLKLLTLFDKFEKIPDLSEMHNYINFNAKCNIGKNLELLDKNRFNLILHPKSKGSAKEWGTDNFEKLTEILPKDKFKIFICGTENERKLMPELAEREDVTDLTGTMSLNEYISFIAHADGLVAASTGPLHIAAVTNINAIGIYPPIRPMHSGRWAALGNKVKIFETKKECETCRKTTFCQCMRDVTPQAVQNYLMLICKNK